MLGAMAETLDYVKLDLDLPDPRRAHPTDAGVDLYSRVDAVVSRDDPPVAVPTGIAIAVPPGRVGLICSRSGLALAGVAVLNAPGVIDHGYSGEISVLLHTVNPVPWTLQRGDRIAQLLIVPVELPALRHVATLAVKPRGPQGFGSSGIR
jgi:dUTP pyrophosphatase